MADADRRSMEAPLFKPPESVRNLGRRSKPPIINNFDHVRRNVRIYGQDLFKAPPLYRQGSSQTTTNTARPEIPPRDVVDRLLRQYVDSMHKSFPVIHWPSFLHEVDQLYATRTFQSMPSAWEAVFFAVLACGTLQTLDGSPNSPRPDSEGMMYLDIASYMARPWPEQLTLNHAKASLLISIFATENNRKSIGWIWLGSAVKIAQDLGLHQETGPWPVIEGEMRRRLWWAIYAWDR